MHRILRRAKKRIVLMDGATGTNLLDKGLKPGESPSVLNTRDPGEVEKVQRAYIEAGSDVILTNTFSANPVNIAAEHLPRVLRAGVRIAQRVAKNTTCVLGDIGPLGELIQPYGTADFEETYSTFKNIAQILWRAGIRAFFLETFTSIIEAKAAFLAAREFTTDIFVSFSLQDNGYTIMGESPETLARTFDELGAQGIGINCTLPDVACTGVERMSRVTPLPLIIKPNAGAVRITGTAIRHSISDKDLARYYARFIKAGASIVGGCCGTTPEYITSLRTKSRIPRTRTCDPGFALVSPRSVVTLQQGKFLTVGERMNPSGRKRVKECLANGDYKVYSVEAQKQERAGVDIHDVNAFIVDRDEVETLSSAVMEVLKSSILPILVDTQNYQAAERVLRFYPGIGVLNSIPARTKELRFWLPMVKKYGFKAVVSLIGNNVPRTVQERIQNANRALCIARKIGFPRSNMIFDPLVFAAATDSDQVMVTLETVRQLHQRGLKTILGISNVSFGLPARSRLNAALISAALASGVTFMIINPLSDDVKKALASCKALYQGKVSEYIAHIRDQKKEDVSSKKRADDLSGAIIHGDPELSVQFARSLVESQVSAQSIIDDHIAGALKEIGDQYEAGKAFIPDLLRAANAAQQALEVIKEHLPKRTSTGTLVLATVKGDIHDIGKNIAAMIFESAGYSVIDLGKDVDSAQIIQAVKKYKPDVLGLSALLTTTMGEMEQVIKHLRERKLLTKVIIGGPNVSEHFARKIGAFGAARTVMDGLRLLKNLK